VKDENIYAVLQVKGFLYGECRPRGYCGCGLEENTLWLKFDNNLKLVDSQSYLTGSCRETISSETKIINDGGGTHIIIEYNDPDVDKEVRLFYNNSEPERGLTK
jgi:hypothetical protein